MSKAKQRRTILHLENNLADRESVKLLFDKRLSLCSRVVHCDMPNSNSSIEDYLAYIAREHAKIDFIIVDMGLTDSDEARYKEAIRSGQYPADLAQLGGGLVVIHEIIRRRLFDWEKIAILTQFAARDLRTDINQIGKRFWKDVSGKEISISTYYKGEGELDLREYVEKHCGVSTESIFFVTDKPHFHEKLENCFRILDAAAPDRLIKWMAFREPESYKEHLFNAGDILEACERYTNLHSRSRFSTAIVDLTLTAEDYETMERCRATRDARGIDRLSSVQIIQTIKRAGDRTETVAVTENGNTPSIVRALMKPATGVDWVIDMHDFELNMFSALWRFIQRLRG